MEHTIDPEFVKRAKAKEDSGSDYHLCIRNGICPKCGADMKVDHWEESEFTDMVCSACNTTYHL